MSNCIKDLFDYDLVKNCSKCENISLKIIFHKNKTKRDGVNSECASCCKEYYMDNSVKLKEKQKEYYSKNRDQIIEYHKKIQKRKQRQDKIL